jgi:NAD+ synthase (glutamine-hydrolysing)
VDQAMRSLEQIALASRGLTAIVGTAYADGDLYNAAAVLHDGHLAAICQKQYLPNYGVFDENRYFRAGYRTQVFLRDGIVFGIGICEDIWYPDGPSESQASLGGAELIVNISASPYNAGKVPHRERMLATRAAENTAFVVYCNIVGGAGRARL